MNDYAKQTCIQFVPRSTSDSNYVYIFPDSGCYSMVGRTGGRQGVSASSQYLFLQHFYCSCHWRAAACRRVSSCMSSCTRWDSFTNSRAPIATHTSIFNGCSDTDIGCALGRVHLECLTRRNSTASIPIGKTSSRACRVSSANTVSE